MIVWEGNIPDPLKDPKNGTPKMAPLLHWGTEGIIKGFPFFGSFRVSGWHLVEALQVAKCQRCQLSCQLSTVELKACRFEDLQCEYGYHIIYDDIP